MACFVSLNIISENWWKTVDFRLSLMFKRVRIDSPTSKQTIQDTTYYWVTTITIVQMSLIHDGLMVTDFTTLLWHRVWQYDRPLSTWWVNNNVNNKQPSCNWQTMTLGIISTHIESECNGFRRRQPVSFQVPTNGTVVYNWFSDLPTFLVTCHSVSTEPPETNGSELLCHN